MDRGIPTEEVLEQMRHSDPPVQYLVGTPKGRLSQYEKSAAGKTLAGGAPRSEGQALAAGSRVVCAGAERRSGRQGTVDAPTAIEMAVAAIKRTPGHGLPTG